MKSACLISYIVALAACGGDPPNTPASPSTPASAPAAAAAMPDASVPDGAAPAAPVAQASARNPNEKKLGDMPFFVTVPPGAVIEKDEMIPDKSAFIRLAPESTYRLHISTLIATSSTSLSKELAALQKQKLTVVSSTGGDDDYSIVFKPYPNMITWERVQKVGAQEMECLVEGMNGTDDIPIYEKICRSVRAAK